MALPAMSGIVLFIAVPFVAAIGLSFFNVLIGSPRPPKFLGFTQYVRLFTDPRGPQFFRALGNNLFFAAVVIPVQTGLALVFAVCSTSSSRASSSSARLLHARRLPHGARRRHLARHPRPQRGRPAEQRGRDRDRRDRGAHNWLGSGNTAMLSVIVLSVWQGVGFQMVIILAALQEIPEERYEAARLDRANVFQQFRYITVPGVRNTLIFVVLLTTIFAFRVYDQVYILITTAGGNETPSAAVPATNASSPEQRRPGCRHLGGPLPDHRRHHPRPASRPAPEERKLSTIRPTRKRLSKAGSYAILIVMSAVMFSPIYYLLIGSFKPSSEVLDGFSGFLPIHRRSRTTSGSSRPSTRTRRGTSGGSWATPSPSRWSSCSAGSSCNSMAGYSFARLQWRGKNAVFVIVVLLIIVPFESVAVPLLFLLNGQRDTLFVQMIPFVANAFSIFLFYTFFLNLPKSIEEAARLDGLGAFGTFARVVVPNARPVFATVAILTFLSSWGSYLWPSIVTSDPTARPLPLEMSVFSGQTPVDWGQTFAFGTLLVLPVLIVFLAFQRFFIQSVAGSAVKG